MEMIVPLLIAAVLLVGLVGGAGPLWRRWAGQKRYRITEDEMLLVFPEEEVGSGPPPARHAPLLPALAREEWAAERPGTPERMTAQAVVVPGGDALQGAVADAGTRGFMEFQDVNALDAPAGPPLEVVEGRAIRFHQADVRTMRLLPGRLEVEEGEDSRAEIRFVDLPGERPEVTFGRRTGEAFRHIQLRSPTVSRVHARMAREGKDWMIANLSQTNPIVVNGIPLVETDEWRTLRHDDRIEMGEVVFRYLAS